MPTFSELNKLREQHVGDQGMQDMLGPLEHRAFVEGAWEDSPMTGAAVTLVSPGYSALKWAAMQEGTDKASAAARNAARYLLKRAGYPVGPMTSRASMDEIFAAIEGGARGAKRTLGQWLDNAD